MKTYICNKCGSEIYGVNLPHGSYQTFDDCGCKSHQLTIQLNLYNSYEDMKCPKCGGYPFKNKPTFETKLVKVIIDKEDPIESINMITNN